MSDVALPRPMQFTSLECDGASTSFAQDRLAGDGGHDDSDVKELRFKNMVLLHLQAPPFECACHAFSTGFRRNDPEA